DEPGPDDDDPDRETGPDDETSADGADGPAPAGGARRRWIALESVLAGGLAGATLLVHNVPHALAQPYWLDEAWVADSTRVPLSGVAALTGPSPIGWTVLLRLMVFGGQQRQRLLPLLLLAGATLVAYLLGRRSPLPKPVGGALAAGAVLFLPHALGRNDLKP